MCRCRTRRAAPGVDDAPGAAGFTLVEVVVAMFVIALGLVALVPLQLRSAQTVGLAHERQQATALTNAALERVRDAATDPTRATAIAAGGPAYPSPGTWTTPTGETLLVSGTSDPSLAQQGPTASVPVFTTRIYVTTRTGDPASTVWITGVTDWVSPNDGAAAHDAGRAQQVVVRSLLYARTS